MNNGRYITAMWEHWAVSNLVTAASINWRIEGWNPGALSVIVSGYFFEHNSGISNRRLRSLTSGFWHGLSVVLVILSSLGGSLCTRPVALPNPQRW